MGVYLFNEVEVGFTDHLLAIRLHAGQSGLKTVSDGEFGSRAPAAIQPRWFAELNLLQLT